MSNRSKVTRRRFVKGAVAGAAVLSVSGNVLGANDKILVGTVGFRGRGNSHIGGLDRLEGVEVVGLCDVDAKVLGKGVEKLEKKGRKVISEKDYRKFVENKDLDVITTATPNHQHAIISIAAIMAGKDVYCEKPVSHNVWEGRQLVNAARKYGKIVQTGTQSRSSRKGLADAVDYVQGGKLGKIKYAVGTCFKPRKNIGKTSDPMKIPTEIDYDLWCGPAEKVDLYRRQFHYDWHWDHNTGNGDMGNQGIHQMDIARWFLGENALSPQILSIGGRVGYDDAGNTPNTQTVVHMYEKAPLIFETRGLPTDKAHQDHRWSRSMPNYRGSRVGVIVQCEGGSIVCPSYTSCKAVDKDGKTIQSWNGGGDHFANFIKAVRSRKINDLHADILEGHLSSALCHTSMVSHQLGTVAKSNEIASRVKDMGPYAESWSRMEEHLVKNGVAIDGGKLLLGALLEMNPKTERFTNNEAANKLLTRPYRKGFEVPDLTPIAKAG